LRLQGSSENLFTVACGLGYPDGFALSNQMHRLTGVRPSQARECLGWEWLVDAWLTTERVDAALAREHCQRASLQDVTSDSEAPDTASGIDQ